jgi:hypothetical protein
MAKQAYTHLLQQQGILRSFSVAKIVKKQEIEELKSLIAEVATTDEEYRELLKIELERISNMHDKNNPIPGIVYHGNDDKERQTLARISQKFCDDIKKKKLTKLQLAFLITSMIGHLDLTQEDFKKLNENLTGGENEDDEYDDNY